MRHREPSDAEITDFVDGRLNGARRAEIEAWLADNPDRAAEVERQRQLNEALRSLGAEILDEPVPERLREVLRGSSSRSDDAVGEEPSDERRGGRSRSNGGRLLSALALLLIGAAIGWIGRSALEPRQSAFDRLLADASYAFTFYNRDREHAIQYPPERLRDFTAVSRDVFDRQIEPPDLAGTGFEFQGARIAPIGRQPSSFFFFEDDHGRDLTVVFWPHRNSEMDEPGSRDLGNVSARFWVSEGIGFMVLGEGDSKSLGDVGDRVFSFYGGDPPG